MIVCMSVLEPLKNMKNAIFIKTFFFYFTLARHNTVTTQI